MAYEHYRHNKFRFAIMSSIYLRLSRFFTNRYLNNDLLPIIDKINT